MEFTKTSSPSQIIEKDGKYLSVNKDFNRCWDEDIHNAILWNLKLDDPTKVHYEKPEELIGAKLIQITTTNIINII